MQMSSKRNRKFNLMNKKTCQSSKMSRKRHKRSKRRMHHKQTIIPSKIPLASKLLKRNKLNNQTKVRATATMNKLKEQPL